MNNVSFAIGVVFCIAVINLFLGLSAALLIGRGPRHLASKGPFHVLRHLLTTAFRQRLLRRPVPRTEPKSATAADHSPKKSTPAEGDVSAAPPPEPVTTTALTDARAAPRAGAGPAPGMPPAQSSGGDRAAGPNRLLTLLADSPPADTRSPTEILQAQLQEQCSPTGGSSATMVAIERADDSIPDDQWARALDAVQQTIRGQLRRDRQVLQSAPGEFAWFAGDMEVEDALLPAERIRQVLTHTQFTAAERMLVLHTALAVVGVTPDDHSEQLLARLRQTIQFARMQPSDSTAIDLGGGPEMAEPLAMELEPSTYDIEA